jgi:hypothetical protein
MSYGKPVDELKNATSIADYLKRGPFAAREIRRICLGSTNYTFRIFLETPYGQRRVDTAILKYAAPYTADEPRVEFSPDRQRYESRALTRIPWDQILHAPCDPSTSESAALAKLNVPELYLEDPMRHIIIMEDGNPRKGPERVWEERSHSARIFFEEFPESHQKYETATQIGQALGSFLARLHNWGSSPQNESLVLDLFGGNASAKDLVIQETVTDFWKNVELAGLQQSSSQKAELDTGLRDLERQIVTRPETIVMGDFWWAPDTPLPSFGKAD